MNSEQALTTAKRYRNETIAEMTELVKALQEDIDRLIRYKHAPTKDGITPQSGHIGFYISQHCLRYEQTMKAGWKMEEWSRLATHLMTQERLNNEQ